MEDKKKQNENNIAMVECPFCNKPIEAPNKVDVIFRCPNCHKELITYDKIAERKQKLKAEKMKQEQKYKLHKNLFKWGSIAAIIIFLIYIGNTAEQVDTKAIYEVTVGHKFPINAEAAKAFDKAKSEGSMAILETVGNNQLFVFFNEGDQVRILRDVVGGFPGCYLVERTFDLQTGLIPKNYLKKIATK